MKFNHICSIAECDGANRAAPRFGNKHNDGHHFAHREQDTQNFPSEWADDDDQQEEDFHDESKLTMNRTPTNQEINVLQLLNVMKHLCVYR